ncbi:unnamed protein product [Paramecium pentaurelia]|uniref:Uncharacterized protein n=1 Tax=Paramecium pentaurelia TaxID=43138 RepID=A0A8S1TM00_9CILI|nr:unnamed protein product [Paramecium pentaurelia]
MGIGEYQKNLKEDERFLIRNGKKKEWIEKEIFIGLIVEFIKDDNYLFKEFWN